MRACSVFLASALALAPLAARPVTPAAVLAPPADIRLAHEIFRELVDINSTHARGTLAAAEVIRKRLLAAGFVPSELSLLAPAEYPRSANLVVRYRGTHPGPGVLFLGHLDVVDAKAEDWSLDPFRYTEQDGWIYGRGAIDMKDDDAALVAALIRLRREHYVPARDLVFAFTADEEAGGDANGPAFLLRNHRDLIDAKIAVNLDGDGGAIENGNRSYFEFGTSEKTYLTFTLETTSPGGHGSLPGPDNAIYRLADGLARIEAYRFPVMVTATTREGFRQLAKLRQGDQARDMAAVAATPTDLAAADRLSGTVRFNATLRTTCVATLIQGGHAENALPQRARATIQCRMMPGDTADAVQAQLTRVLNDPAIRISLDAAPIVSPESPPTPALLARVAGVIHSLWPGVAIVPTMATGFSDDRQTRNAGIPSYDLSGIWMEADENRAHGRDERVSVQAFDEEIEYVYRLVREFGKAE